MFINFSNHPSAKWSEEQKTAARKYGEIKDIPFPAVDPLWDMNLVEEKAEEYVQMFISATPDAVLCQGEFSLFYAIVRRLLSAGITVLVACSERNSREIHENGVTKKQIIFNFVQFRQLK